MKTMTPEAAEPSKSGPATKKLAAFVLGPIDDDILRAVWRYHYLTIDQITRLHYSPKARTTASTRLKKLAEAGYLHRIVVPARLGNGPLVYALANRGLRFLASAGLPIPKRTRLSAEREYSYLFFSHTLAVNDFLIDAERLAHTHPALVLAQMRHERDLKRSPVLVTDSTGGKVAVIPDGYLDFRLGGQYRTCLALELDRGTEDQAAWRKKVRALLAFASGPYQQAFGTDALTICVVATPGHARLQQLYGWTADELQQVGRRQEADLFRFAAFTPGTITPEQVFFGAGWYIPFATTPVPLIDRTYLQAARPAGIGATLAPPP